MPLQNKIQNVWQPNLELETELTSPFMEEIVLELPLQESEKMQSPASLLNLESPFLDVFDNEALHLDNSETQESEDYRDEAYEAFDKEGEHSGEEQFIGMLDGELDELGDDEAADFEDDESDNEEWEVMTPRQADGGDRDGPAVVRNGYVGEDYGISTEFLAEWNPQNFGIDEEKEGHSEEEEVFSETVYEEWEDLNESEESWGNTYEIEQFFEGELSARRIRKANKWNPIYAKRLKWNTSAGKIKRFLMSSLGLSSITSNDDFAQAVATWQHSIGGNKNPDGIIGPNTWGKLKRAMRAPVSPSQVKSLDVQKADLDPRHLAIGIYENGYIMLEAWESALTQFYVVLESVSDAEGVADFAGTMKRYIKEQLIGTIVKGSKVVSLAKGLMDKLVKENLRADMARDAAQVRDFFLRIARALNQMKIAHAQKKGEYLFLVENSVKGMSKAEKEAYKKRLVEHAQYLDQRIEDGWLNDSRMFQLFAFEWIRNTKKSFMRGNVTESLIRVWVKVEGVQLGSRSLKIQKVRINAHGGGKIAEQLLKDKGGAGLRPYEWPVRRIILFMQGNSSFPFAVGRYTKDGTWESNRISQKPQEADNLLKQMLAERPTTKDVK